MVFPVLFLLFTATTLQYTEAKVEWISRPRSRLFVNAGEAARITWKFPEGAMAITYEKKSTILGDGDGTRIAYKQDAAEPVILDGYKNKIKIHKSGALSILKAGLEDEGFYRVNIVYKSNSLEDEVELKIQEAPVITTFPAHTKSEVFYMGMTVNLVCMAKGRPVPEVQWVKDGTVKPLQKSTGSILHQITSASKEDSGRYTCLATNQAGKANSSIEYIFFRRPYDVDFVHNSALDGTIYEGESVIFTCYAKGNPPINYYKLLHNGKEIDRSSSGAYLINEVRRKDNGTYTCIPINKAGLGENRTVALKVQGRPGYWEEKLKSTTPLPTEKVPVITQNVDTSEQQSTEILLTPTKSHVEGAANIVMENIILLSLLLFTTEIIKQFA